MRSKLEKNPLVFEKFALRISDEYRSTDKSASEKYFALAKEQYSNLRSSNNKLDFFISLAYNRINSKDFKGTEKYLDSIKVLAFKANDKISKGKYLACYGNYLRVNHEENENDHFQIYNTLKRSIEMLQGADSYELSRPLFSLMAFIGNERYHEDELYKITDAFDSISNKIVSPDTRSKHFRQIGRVYWNSKVHPDKTIKAFYKAIEGYQLVRDTVNVIELKVMIGGLLADFNDFERAETNLKEAITLSAKFSGKNSAKANSNMGLAYNYLTDIYKHKGNFNEVIKCYNKSIEYLKLSNNEYSIPLFLGNLGLYYSELKMYDSAMKVQKEALRLRLKFGNKEGELFSYGSLASLANIKKQPDTAIYFAEKSLVIANEINIHTYDKNAFYPLYEAYKIKGDYLRSNYYLERYYKFIDSVNRLINKSELNKIVGQHEKDILQANFQKQQALNQLTIQHNLYTIERNRNMMLLLEEDNNIQAYNIEKSKTKERYNSLLISNKEKEIGYLNLDKKLKEIEMIKRKNELKQKQRIIFIISLAGVVILLLLMFVINSFNKSKRQNAIIRSQKQEVENQKRIIEEKHKEITDSINYAERIQRSFIATKDVLDENLKDYFVFFKPKDVVSGDFYWASKLATSNGVEKFALVTADSTGHGVPGAIMSLLNITSLEKAIETETEPSGILNVTRKIIIERLKKDGSEHGGKDGMDASLLVFDFKKKRLHISAANNPVWIIRDGEIIEIKPDKMPVGKHDKDTIPFTQQTIELQSNDIIYAITDGFPDQFGGPLGKKFMSKNLKELLKNNSHLSMDEQKALLDSTFKNWIGALEQVDDVTIVGVRV